jgi:hypothetical protein
VESSEADQEGVLSDAPQTGADEVESEGTEPEERSGGVVKEGQ